MRMRGASQATYWKYFSRWCLCVVCCASDGARAHVQLQPTSLERFTKKHINRACIGRRTAALGREGACVSGRDLYSAWRFQQLEPPCRLQLQPTCFPSKVTDRSPVINDQALLTFSPSSSELTETQKTSLSKPLACDPCAYTDQ